MTLLAITFLAFGLADLLRDHGGKSRLRSGLAVIGAVVVASGVARLAGISWSTVWITGGAELAVVALWVVLDTRVEKQPARAIVALLLVVGAPVAAFAASGAMPVVAGDLEKWFSNLAIKQPKDPAAPDQVLVALAACVYLLASANRVVRLVLVIARTPTGVAESRLKGGRLIGPMERLFIVAMLVAAEPAVSRSSSLRKGYSGFRRSRSQTTLERSTSSPSTSS
jgi:hypothetical protein